MCVYICLTFNWKDNDDNVFLKSVLFCLNVESYSILKSVLFCLNVAFYFV